MRPVLTPLLALLWVLITGSATPANVLLGVGAALLALAIVRQPQHGATRYSFRPLRLLVLAATFLRELAKSAISVALTVVSPRIQVQPGIFAFPLTVQRDFEITLLANLITLTPGTLSVDVSNDRKTLFVHALDCSDPDAVRRSIANGFERHILEAFR
jgi:multicomponent Na+:H+ antiporter subunit E